MSKYNQNDNGDESENADDGPNHPCRCAGLGGRLAICLLVGTGLDF